MKTEKGYKKTNPSEAGSEINMKYRTVGGAIDEEENGLHDGVRLGQ